MLDRLGNQRAGLGSRSDDEAAVGLQKDREQAVHQLRQHVVQPQGLAQALADSISALSLAVVLSPKRRLERDRRDVELGHDGRAAPEFFVVDQHGGRSAASSTRLATAKLQIGRALVEDEHQVADAQLVVFAERLATHQGRPLRNVPLRLSRSST